MYLSLDTSRSSFQTQSSNRKKIWRNRKKQWNQFLTPLQLAESCIGTRVDLAYPVGVISWFMSKPLKEHWQAVKWVLTYLKFSTEMKLVFKRQEKFVLRGYCDSDFSDELDHMRSTGGYFFTLGGETISWRSSLQSHYPLHGGGQIYGSCWSRKRSSLDKEIDEWDGFSSRSKWSLLRLSECNCTVQECCIPRENKTYCSEVSLHRDLIADELVNMTKIPTLYNPADILTKVLPVGKLQDATSGEAPRCSGATPAIKELTVVRRILRNPRTTIKRTQIQGGVLLNYLWVIKEEELFLLLTAKYGRWAKCVRSPWKMFLPVRPSR